MVGHLFWPNSRMERVKKNVKMRLPPLPSNLQEFSSLFFNVFVRLECVQKPKPKQILLKIRKPKDFIENRW